MAETITINLPHDLYQQLQRLAELARQPLDYIITQSLGQILPPLLEDIPTEYQAEVYPLLQMNVAELRQEAQRTFSSARWAVYESLLEQKKLRALTSEETKDLAVLRHEADILTLRKGYALVLLKRRGYTLPFLEAIG